ncbi:sigma-70 family RNA polymerase sigma factor [Flavobacterium sp. NKUCC04_CG]|nr:sigma-70 family RNA polymerase sigma factor [Flavobacterium sp. NKUCC04_CG]
MAQHDVYHRYAPRMLSVCRQYVRDVQQAEHVMVGGFVKVFRHVVDFENKGNFEGWIRRIMVNESLSFLRSEKKVLFLEDQVYSEVVEEGSFDSDMGVAEIQCFIDQLPTGARMVFNLFVIEGYKHVEIAKLLGIQEGTSKSQLAQARKILQRQLLTINKGIWSSGAK